MLFNTKSRLVASSRNQQRGPLVPGRDVIDVGRAPWKDVGGAGPDVILVQGHARGQDHRRQDVDPRAGPSAVPSLLCSEGTGSGGEPVLQEVPGPDPEAAQVCGLTELASSEFPLVRRLFYK